MSHMIYLYFEPSVRKKIIQIMLLFWDINTQSKYLVPVLTRTQTNLTCQVYYHTIVFSIQFVSKVETC